MGNIRLTPKHLVSRIRKSPVSQVLISIIFFFLALVLFACFDLWFAYSAWRGWAMLESIGTVLAILAAILLAWWEGTNSRRKDSKQRQAIRHLLYKEVKANLDAIAALRSWAEERVNCTQGLLAEHDGQRQWMEVWSFPVELEQPSVRPENLRNQTKNKLDEQLDLFSRAFDADEIALIDELYCELDEIVESLEGFSLFNELTKLADIDTVHRDLFWHTKQFTALCKYFLAPFGPA